tara:strand:- start:240 stop:539 length:300 start_codon:yes stop_codon:yes gene_type:complete
VVVEVSFRIVIPLHMCLGDLVVEVFQELLKLHFNQLRTLIIVLFKTLEVMVVEVMDHPLVDGEAAVAPVVLVVTDQVELVDLVVPEPHSHYSQHLCLHL